MLICGIIGVILGVVLTLIFLLPKVRYQEKLNEDIAYQNETLQKDNEKLNYTKQDIANNIIQLKGEQSQLAQSVSIMQMQADQAGQALYDKSIKLAEEKARQETLLLEKQLEEYKSLYQKEYLLMMNDFAQDGKVQIDKTKKDLLILKQEIEDNAKIIANQKQIAAAAIASNKKALEEAEKKDFYKLQITKEDKEEIDKLYTIVPVLRNREPLDKVIWKMYYEKPTTDLIGRLIGTQTKTGIYKITNLINGMSYVGQSVNIADRFRAHIKAGLGIDSSNNKLYTAMKKDRVENFMFEIIEECDRTLLNEKEKYWIEFFQSESFGYNMTKGNK